MKKQIKRRIKRSQYIFYQETLVDFKDHFWSFLGAFFGIGIIAFLQSQQISEIENVFLIGSFGASSVLIYGAVNSPLAQPRNLIGGHVFSALVGVTVYKLCRIFGSSIFNCRNANYKNNASSRWCDGFDCGSSSSENSGIGILVCVVAGFEWRNYFACCGFDFQ